MIIILLAVAVFIALVIRRGIKNKKLQKEIDPEGKYKDWQQPKAAERKRLKKDSYPTVSELVKKVKNRKDFEELEEELEQIYLEYKEDYNDKYWGTRYDRYEDAVAKADNKLFKQDK